MEYEVGRIARVAVARLFEGEDVYGQIESLAAKERISNAFVLIVGGFRKARVVVGPKNPTGLIEPNFVEFDDAREVAGVGTIFPEDGRPKLHLHAAIGRGPIAIAGCPRGGAKVFCVVEAIIAEIEGVKADRRLDPQLGLKLLRLGS